MFIIISPTPNKYVSPPLTFIDKNGVAFMDKKGYVHLLCFSKKIICVIRITDSLIWFFGNKTLTRN